MRFGRLKTLAPPTLAFVVTVLALLPSIFSLSQHGDEKMYIWKAYYYGSRLVHFDFTPGDDEYLNPGWKPTTFWAVEQPLGSHLIYAMAMGITRSEPPKSPWLWGTVEWQGPETAIPPGTLRVVRLAAILCDTIGLTLVAYRLGYAGLLGIALFLLIPHVRGDLARAWAEGPLLLGIGLCVASFGSRWFGFAVGLTTSFKLTAVVLWPLLLSRKAVGLSHYGRPAALASSVAAWIVSNPVSWFGGGILYLVILVGYRIQAFLYQSEHMETNTIGGFGLFLPTRYLWPLELGLLLLLSHLVTGYLQRGKGLLTKAV